MEAETLNVSDSTPTFESLELAPFLQKTISNVGYTTPTPIQAQAIPLLLQGSDLIGLAQTGTGKTAAFVLPLLNKLSSSETPRATKALILAPTRELAEQINDVINTFAPRTGVKSVTIYGGVSHQNQIRALRGKPEIIVACPGRLLDHMGGRTVDLSTVEYLVLDEADRMLDMGFLPDIKQIVAQMPKERQTMLFSATMPDEIRSLSGQILRDPKVVKVKTEAAVASVTHSMYQIKDTEKQTMLTSWLSANPEALVVVFTKMKHTAKRLSERLEKNGFDATSLHGNLSQGKRQYALNGFRDGKYRIMIATDIAARGIDVDGITHVINYDMPETLDAYIHRTGRAGRAMRTGDAISFITRADGYILRQVEKWVGTPLHRLNAGDVPEVQLTAQESEREESPRRGRQGQGRSQRGGRGERSAGRREGGRGFKRTERASDEPRESRVAAEGAEGAVAVQATEGGERTERRRPAGRFDRRERSDRRDGQRGERSRGDRGSRGPRGDRRESFGNRRPRTSGDEPRVFNERGASRFDRMFGVAEEGEASQGRPSSRGPRGDRSERREGGRPSFRDRGERRGGGERRFGGRREDGERSGGRFGGERRGRGNGPRGDSFRGGREERSERPGRSFRGQQDIADTSGALVGQRPARGDRPARSEHRGGSAGGKGRFGRSDRGSGFGGDRRSGGGDRRGGRTGGRSKGFGGQSRRPRMAAYD